MKRETFGLDQDDAVLLKTASTFDLSVWSFGLRWFRVRGW